MILILIITKNNLMTSKNIYSILLNNIHIVLSSIIKNFEMKYKESIHNVPENYDGVFSGKAISDIRIFCEKRIRTKIT